MQLLIGFCQGYYLKERTVNGAKGQSNITEHYVLIQTTELNQFGLPEEKTTMVRLAKKHIENGVHHLWDQMKGKQVAACFFIQPWASKAGNAGYDRWFSGDGKPVTSIPGLTKPVSSAPSVAAAS